MKLLFLMLALLIMGCEDKAKESTLPGWVADILSRTTNDDSLEGNWIFESVIIHDNDDCSGTGKAVDYNGTVTYNETAAFRTENIMMTWADFEQKDYTEQEFQELCAEKDGDLNAIGDCAITIEITFEYFLSAAGYCETIVFAGKDGNEDVEKTFCGDISILDDVAEITFTWTSEIWDKSGCKSISLTPIE